MITILRGCVARNIWVATLKVKVTASGFEFKLAYWQNASWNLIMPVKITLTGIYLQVTVHFGSLHNCYLLSWYDWQLPAAVADDVYLKNLKINFKLLYRYLFFLWLYFDGLFIIAKHYWLEYPRYFIRVQCKCIALLCKVFTFKLKYLFILSRSVPLSFKVVGVIKYKIC
jgi:hypothetical protein